MSMGSTLTERWERKLGIATCAGEYEKEDAHHSRYEPTDYLVLERLSDSGYIKKRHVLVDYGCGKGRVGFFLNHRLSCRTIGVEYNPELYEEALKNLSGYAVWGRKGGVSFVCEDAESFRPEEGNCFYFFNPFSVKILRSVLERIYESYYSRPREIYLFFYYPLDEYLSCLMHEDGLCYVDEIDCRDLFDTNDSRERILIFSLAHEFKLEDYFYIE